MFRVNSRIYKQQSQSSEIFDFSTVIKKLEKSEQLSEVGRKDMLKGLYRCAILNKVENGICCLKMQNQKYSRNQQNFDENRQNKSDELRRDWVLLENEPRKRGQAFTVLNYNILAQQLLEMHNYLYTDHHQRNLRWNQRFYNLVGEILHFQPDILCCQEVQKSHLNEIQGRLRSLNLDVVYKKRTGDKPDGCAIFYKRHLFNLIEHHKIEFEQPGIELLDRENVAVVCKFELKSDPSVRFIVATTHLLYNPKRQDIRLAQVQILLAELDRIAKVKDESGKSHFPIILSGDFNLQPYSAPYNLIVNGMINYESLSRRTLRPESKANGQVNGRALLPIKLGITDACQHINHEITKLYHSENNRAKMYHDIELTKEIVNLFQTGVLRHNFEFNTVYENPDQFVSTYQDRWVLVDYVFYTKGSKKSKSDLKLLSFLALPSAEKCDGIGLRIPNTYLGSDHLSLAARFFISSSNSSSEPSTSTKL